MVPLHLTNTKSASLIVTKTLHIFSNLAKVGYLSVLERSSEEHEWDTTGIFHWSEEHKYPANSHTTEHDIPITA